MKLIPCPRCGRPAVGPKNEQFPDGAPVVFGRFTGGAAPIVVKCFRCTGSFKLDARTYSGLPEMTKTELEGLGLDKVV